jgi:hypothetical protein
MGGAYITGFSFSLCIIIVASTVPIIAISAV